WSKDRADAEKEHVAARVNQARDNWGLVGEERPTSQRQRRDARVAADLPDLRRVGPDGVVGRLFWHSVSANSQGKPPV
ncbi:hypothetical protein, partial [Stenotrophomonas sp. SrG]|uniref:hypothetical protein n=1 Tax=Stenotrophomonas sp. SrG TaxID=3414430 RepID=UPI003CF03AFD